LYFNSSAINFNVCWKTRSNIASAVGRLDFKVYGVNCTPFVTTIMAHQDGLSDYLKHLLYSTDKENINYFSQTN